MLKLGQYVKYEEGVLQCNNVESNGCSRAFKVFEINDDLDGLANNELADGSSIIRSLREIGTVGSRRWRALSRR